MTNTNIDHILSKIYDDINWCPQENHVSFRIILTVCIFSSHVRTIEMDISKGNTCNMLLHDEPITITVEALA